MKSNGDGWLNDILNVLAITQQDTQKIVKMVKFTCIQPYQKILKKNKEANDNIYFSSLGRCDMTVLSEGIFQRSIYLYGKGRFVERRKEKETDFIFWFSLQMVTMAGA